MPPFLLPVFCPHCSQKLECHDSLMHPGDIPGVGALLLCWECCRGSSYEGNRRARPLTVAEAKDQTIVTLQGEMRKLKRQGLDVHTATATLRRKYEVGRR